MRAARLHDYDPDLEREELLSFEEVPEPTIEAPDQVIVRVGASGVCRTDLHIIQGVWREAQQTDLPYTLGHENAGRVEATGDGVRSLRQGDPVVVLPGMACGSCDTCRRGLDNQCPSLVWQGIQVDGGFTRYLRTSIRNLVPVPDGMSLAQAAPYADAGITSYHASSIAANELRPGDDVVVIGVGGLGHVAVQVLRAITAARVIAVDTAPGALRFAEQVGADEAVLAGDDVVEEILELTDGGARAVIDFVGEAGVPDRAFAMTSAGGLLVMVGYGGTLTIPTLDIMGSERRLAGAVGGTYTDLRELMALAARGQVDLAVTEYPFEDINRALHDLASGHLRGRGVLVHTD